MPSKSKSKPNVKLSDRDGNAFAVIAACVRAAKNAGWTQPEIDAVIGEMKSGDYGKLLRVAMTHFVVR